MSYSEHPGVQNQPAPQLAPDDFTSDIILPPDRPPGQGQPAPEAPAAEPPVRAMERIETPVREPPPRAMERSEPRRETRREPRREPLIRDRERSEPLVRSQPRSEPPGRKREKSEGRSEVGQGDDKQDQKKPFQIAEFLSALKVCTEEMI